MRFATAFLLGASVVATSASLMARQSGLPHCAQTCVANNLGGCKITNVTCLCTDQTFLNNSGKCVQANCSTTDQKTAQTAAEDLCNAVTGTISFTSLPTSSASSNNSASTTVSASNSSPTSPVPSTSSPAPAAKKAAATTHGVNGLIGLGAFLSVVALVL